MTSRLKLMKTYGGLAGALSMFRVCFVAFNSKIGYLENIVVLTYS